jgi:hypothetical protein
MFDLLQPCRKILFQKNDLCFERTESVFLNYNIYILKMHINRECSLSSQKLREAKEIIILMIPFIHRMMIL